MQSTDFRQILNKLIHIKMLVHTLITRNFLFVIAFKLTFRMKTEVRISFCEVKTKYFSFLIFKQLLLIRYHYQFVEY